MKITHYAQGALALCLLAGTTGCSSVNNEYGVQMSAEKVAQIKRGVTTRAEVEALLGPATNVSMMPEGRRMLTYSYTSTNVQGHPTAATFIPYAGLFMGGSKAEGQTRTQILQVMLNGQGIVEDYEFSDNTKNIDATTGGLMGVANQSTTTTTQPTGGK